MPFNLANVGGFDALDNGWYPVRLKSFKQGTSKTGNTKIDLVFSVTDEELQNRQLFKTLSLQPQALWVLKQYLQVMGVSEDEMNKDYDTEAEFIVGIMEILGECVGAEFEVRVSKVPKQTATGQVVEGQFVNQVEEVRGAGSANPWA